MTVSEKVAYLKGLMEGMKIDTEKDEGKILSVVVEILDELCEEIDALDDAQIELAEQLDAVDEDLSAVEEVLYDDDDEDDDDDDYEFEDDEVYEVTCPNCNDVVYIDGEMLMDGRIDCPNCGTELEFDLDCDCDNCNCDECNND